eukprot:TRINITY_DN1171_c0_g1_i2.p1 TRINITY_DN1171_c0_g1~~TRINITY_DN1171_c0_g1_i2.p1  ORF type:complete len:456 (-),score=87.44 TRINITY_DN1171_c0_g1_i2:25-1392(-)
MMDLTPTVLTLTCVLASVISSRGNLVEDDAHEVSRRSLIQVSESVTASRPVNEEHGEGLGTFNGFHCHEALEEWRRGWSQWKIRWCCENEGIACEFVQHANLPHTQGDTLEGVLKLESSVEIIVEVYTANSTYAGTTTGASMAFEVGAHWTDELELVHEANGSDVIARSVRLPRWPTSMRITALGPNAWGYDSIYLYTTNRKKHTVKVALLNFTNTVHPCTRGSRYWVDADGRAPTENTYSVPPLKTGDLPNQTCVTKKDPRIDAMLTDTSPEGTPCVFGADPADEGEHCIYDDGKYGSFGWCYTALDQGSWGSCSVNCPLSGQFEILGTKLDEVLRRLKRLRAESPKAAATGTLVNATVGSPSNSTIASPTSTSTTGNTGSQAASTDTAETPAAADSEAAAAGNAEAPAAADSQASVAGNAEAPAAANSEAAAAGNAEAPAAADSQAMSSTVTA